MKHESAQTAPLERPSTIVEWQARITKLKDEAAGAEATLKEKRASRRAAAAGVILFGGDRADALRLEEAERDLERSIDSLRAALEVAAAEVAKLEEGERLAAAEAKRVALEANARRALEKADAFDTHLAAACSELTGFLDCLARNSELGGGAVGGLPKGFVTRALLKAGFRPFIELAGPAGHASPLRSVAEAMAADGVPSTEREDAERKGEKKS